MLVKMCTWNLISLDHNQEGRSEKRYSIIKQGFFTFTLIWIIYQIMIHFLIKAIEILKHIGRRKIFNIQK